MGEGLKRIAEACGGMRVSARGVTVDYVPNDTNARKVISKRQRDGWEHIGNTPDDEFLQFRKPTVEVEPSNSIKG